MKKISRLVPIGVQCRNAYQCRLNSDKFMLLKTKSGPFDWTICYFQSLSKIISEDINEKLILNPIDSYINKYGSVTCGYSGIIFHHDLNPNFVKSFGEIKNQQVVSKMIETKQWSDAKSRFLHTLKNLVQTSKEEGNLYVRWKKDPSDEDAVKTYELLRSNKWLNNSGLLFVTTELVEGVKEPFKKPIKSISKISNN